MRFIRLRSIQLFACFGLLLLSILIYGIALDSPAEEADEIIEVLEPVVPQQVSETTDSIRPIIVEGESEPNDSSAPPMPEPEPAAVKQPPIMDVFKPSNDTDDNAVVIDNLKQQYEDTIILYHIMQRCNYTLTTDYGWIAASMNKDMQTVGAPPELSQQILSAASGSYQELYATSNCKDPGIASLSKQYRDYIRSLSGPAN